MTQELEPEYAKFVGHALLETRDLLDEEKSAIETLDGEVYEDGVVFDYDEFLNEVGSEDSYRWTEQDNIDHIAVAETEDELVSTISLYQNENRTVVTSQDLSNPMGTGSRY